MVLQRRYLSHKEKQDKILKLNIVDAHGNPCERVSGLELRLEMTLTESVASTPGLTKHCTVLSNMTALVEEGIGDFGELQLTHGIPGFYSLKVSPAR